MNKLGKPYTFKCTAAIFPDSERACGKEAVTPIETDGSAYCEWHKDEADSSKVLVIK